MRFCDWAFLGILFVLAISFLGPGNTVRAQSVQIGTAQNQLSIAFVALQEADEQGAPQVQVSLLASNLNAALSYLENATAVSTKDPSASDTYSNKSATLSVTTTIQAHDLTIVARNQSLLNHVGTYSLALVAAFVMATFVLESHRLRKLLERTGIRQKRFD